MSGRKLLISEYSCLLFLLILILDRHACTARETNPCPASSCGNIPNISHPFRLTTDPKGCGNNNYELLCENNLAVLFLFSAKYYVQAINYNNRTIRLADADIKQNDCSSLPTHSLTSRQILSDSDFYTQIYPDAFSPPKELFQSLVFVQCTENPGNASCYADTSPCNITGAHGYYSYVTVGPVTVWELPDSCRIEQTVLTSLLPNDEKTIAYKDVHNGMVYGFELSWAKALEKIPVIRGGDQERLDSAGEESLSLLMAIPIYIVSWDDVNEEFMNFILWSWEPSLLTWLRAFLGIYVYAIFDLCTHLPDPIRTSARTALDGQLCSDALELLSKMPPFLRLFFKHSYFVAFLVFFHVVLFICGAPCVAIFLIYKWRRRHLSIYDTVEEFLQSNDNLMPIRYSYSDIKKMTKNFSDKLGEGGYGSVYKGKLRSGRFAAIKMLGKSTANGQDFINEVATIGRIHHVNVVQLIGFCVEGSKRALIYEFMPNGSLDKYIFSNDQREGCIQLSNGKLYDIALGIARGIEYLHRGCDMQILHFDIKPHNILLDDKFNPKVSDFGLAKLYSTGDSIVTLTAARGTLGYMAPELFYKNIGGVSYKADVYSFGMLLMEIVGRRRNFNRLATHSSQVYFPSWIYDQYSEQKEIELGDTTKEDKEITKKMIIVALWCIQLRPDFRPSMHKVLEMLEGEVESLEMPPKPYTGIDASSTGTTETSTDDYMDSSSSDFDTNSVHEQQFTSRGEVFDSS